SSTVARTLLTPRRCPSMRGKPRRLAQRPLPSMMIATCAGSFAGSSPAAAIRSKVSVLKRDMHIASETQALQTVGFSNHDRLLPVRADGNDADRQSQQFLQPVHVTTRRSRQVGDLANVGQVGLPAGHRLVDRLASLQEKRIAGKMLPA